VIWKADDYLIPPEGYLTRKGSRDDRVIWRLVRRVAHRANVDAHVHALRAAFAVFYLERHPGDVEALQELMGHRSIATTQVYLRKLDRQRAMERVRDLSWGVATADSSDQAEKPQSAEKRFASSAGVGAGGFEPP
jgi:integrase